MTTGMGDVLSEVHPCVVRTGPPAGRPARLAMIPLLLALACSTAACSDDDRPALGDRVSEHRADEHLEVLIARRLGAPALADALAFA